MIVTQYIGNKSFKVFDKKKEPPMAGEVRIKVAFVGICGTDIHIFHGMMDNRLNIPETIGHEMSGIVDSVGEGVTDFTVGDKVVVRPLDDRKVKPSDKGYNHICEELKFIGIDSPGAMQQYWNVPAFTLHKLKENTDLKLAALIEPLSVATHDVRLSGLKAGEDAGAQVIISEVNPRRIAKAKELGFDAVNPLEVDLVKYVSDKTEKRKADVVFEVAGVQPALDIMTEVAGIRGRIVMVAIHGDKKPIDLFKFFWKELKLIGARVYEKEDYEKSIDLITENELPFGEMITDVQPLSNIQNVFDNIDKNPAGMKVLLNCSL